MIASWEYGYIRLQKIAAKACDFTREYSLVNLAAQPSCLSRDSCLSDILHLASSLRREIDLLETESTDYDRC